METIGSAQVKSAILLAALNTPGITQIEVKKTSRNHTENLLTKMHFYGWKKGLKTGMYYLRTRPSSKALQFTVEPEKECDSCSG